LGTLHLILKYLNNHMIVLFVETPRKFITAKLSIRKPGSSSVLIICILWQQLLRGTSNWSIGNFWRPQKKIGTSLQNLSRHGLPNGSGKKDNQIKRGSNKRQKTSSQASSLPSNSTTMLSTHHAMLPPCNNQQLNSNAAVSQLSSSINTLPLRGKYRKYIAIERKYTAIAECEPI
jgi:hypothetical protein